MTQSDPVRLIVEMADGIVQSLRPIIDVHNRGQVAKDELAEESALALVHAYLKIVQAIEAVTTSHELLLQLAERSRCHTLEE